jgi:hypothetical protein
LDNFISLYGRSASSSPAIALLIQPIKDQQSPQKDVIAAAGSSINIFFYGQKAGLTTWNRASFVLVPINLNRTKGANPAWKWRKR